MSAPDYWKLTFDKDGRLTDPRPDLFPVHGRDVRAV